MITLHLYFLSRFISSISLLFTLSFSEKIYQEVQETSLFLAFLSVHTIFWMEREEATFQIHAQLESINILGHSILRFPWCLYSDSFHSVHSWYYSSLKTLLKFGCKWAFKLQWWLWLFCYVLLCLNLQYWLLNDKDRGNYAKNKTD